VIFKEIEAIEMIKISTIEWNGMFAFQNGTSFQINDARGINLPLTCH